MNRFAPVIVITVALGCSGGGSGGADLPSFHDIGSAPSKIQTAADAVVRIRMAAGYGTGAFISSTGLLLTNDHVLGDTVCPIEGCSIQLTFGLEIGKPVPTPMTVFAVPQAVDVGLDMTVAQIYDASRTALSTPAFLSFHDVDAASLLGMHVTVVGHPEGELKKWTDGVVVDAFGNWFTADAYSLPGNSGSPMLDDDGDIVGLLHRGPTTEDLITNDSVDVYSIGTASAALDAAMSAPLPSVMISLTAETTAQDLVTNDLVYLNGHATEASVGGTATNVLSALGQACDTALARTDFVSPDDLTAALQPCNDGQRWIECRIDATLPAYGVTCPGASEAAAWATRFQTMNQLWVAMNGNTDLSPLSFGIAALSASKAAGLSAGATSLQAALTAAGQVLDFSVANDLSAFAVPSYAGNDTLTWLRAYKSRPDYALFASSIASAYLWSTDNGLIDSSEARSALADLAGNNEVDVGSKLYIQTYQYLRGY
jgi:S1-C subfamily serine protease